MINERNAQAYCCEDISKIENYDKAIADKTQTWVCHHKQEILDDGTKVSPDELIKQSLYYHRPANELIFLTATQHNTLHHKGKHLSEAVKKKISTNHKPWNNPEDVKKKLSKSASLRISNRLGHTHSAETKRKMSEALKRYWQRKKKE